MTFDVCQYDAYTDSYRLVATPQARDGRLACAAAKLNNCLTGGLYYRAHVEPCQAVIKAGTIAAYLLTPS